MNDIRLSYLLALALEDTAEADLVRVHRDYYSGDHPTYLTDRQKEFLALKNDYKFRANYCAPVCDIAAERLQVQAFDGGQEEAGEQLAALAWQWWTDNRMDAGQDDLHVSGIRDGVAFLIVDWDNEEGRPRWTPNYAYDGTRGVKVHYHSDTDDIIFASKRWHEDDQKIPGQTGKARLTLYFPDVVEKYRASQRAAGGWEPVVIEADGREVDWPTPWTDKAGQPLGVAVVPFDNPGGSEIKDALPLQDMLNKALLDLVAASDVEGFGILYASGVSPTIDPATGAETEMTLGPGRLIKLSNPQARMGRVSPEDLTRLTAVADFWIAQIAAITRTPMHLFQRWEREPPSGESLKMQETGLISKTKRKQTVYGNSYEDAVALSARLYNAFSGEAALEIVPVSVTWQDAAIRDEKAHQENMESKKRLGVPEAQLWRELGYDQAQVDQFKKEREAGRDQAIGLMVRQIATAEAEAGNGRPADT